MLFVMVTGSDQPNVAIIAGSTVAGVFILLAVIATVISCVVVLSKRRGRTYV